MRKVLILAICGLILSFPFSALYSWMYEKTLIGEFYLHEGGNCGCSSCYTWINFLYSIDQAHSFYTYDFILNLLGEDVTDEEMAAFLTTYVQNDKHTVLSAIYKNPTDEEIDVVWQEIALSIINTKRPHIQTFVLFV